MEKTFHVYILASKSRAIYTGVTGNLTRRLGQHKQKKIPGFTQRYNITKLVWLEEHGTAAIAREKEIKAWRRAKKVALIQKLNPRWKDLSEDPG